ncbi:hypothetical protein [Microcystis aeruginosa]|uniref:Uncharacterized protein n=1 Tax=Microcystis aeruginosa FD4 TaxID=2686288 RepID=A0A857D0C4_MICAE|nr:hypothetical protein [Microcystis aeruginosa]QGZ88650.1 hypothetical protein GQR42_02495 [Microcystis aeruginosa FD4]
MKIGKTLHPTPHTPHPTPTEKLFQQPLFKSRVDLAYAKKRGIKIAPRL